MPSRRMLFVFSVIVIVAMVMLAGCGAPPAPRNPEDGAFEGTVARVWEDGMTVNVDGGGTISIDTWSVCGDATARNISAGDSVRVYATRDLASYDAWRILNADGQPACGEVPGTVAQTSDTGAEPVRAQRSADDGAFEGTVARVWEDGMTVDVDGGGTIAVDTWSVCGDATARNISAGDSVRVYANRDLVGYEAWRILDAEGQPACDPLGTRSEAVTGAADARPQRSADDGAFEGTVARVWEDGMTVDVDGGGTITVDTWSVCGDNTARNISSGDRVRVYASRELLTYDAWRILDAEGQPACPR